MSPTPIPTSYTESSICTLDWVQHLRRRPGMYIGRIGDGSHACDGIYILLKEILDNGIDEFVMGAGTAITILRTGMTMSVRDHGRGIPLGKVVACVSQVNTGGKFNDDVFQFSVGMNGIGTKAVNALSSRFEVVSHRDGRFKRALFMRGKLIDEEDGRTKEPDGTQVTFTPDEEVFPRFTWHEELVIRRLHYYAYLNAGLTITYNGLRYASTGGLADLVAQEVAIGDVHYPIHHHRDGRLTFALTHVPAYGETIRGFVNGQFTNDGGTHVSAFREGLVKGINAFAGESLGSDDVRDGLVAAVAIRLQEPQFDGQAKAKCTSDVRSWLVPAVQAAVEKWLHFDAAVAERLLEKVKANERLRTELAKIKKEARERAKSVALRIPKLRDCKFHYHEVDEKRREETSLFITEGDSAGGSLVQCRDLETQAIFAIKGKPLNCYGLGKETVYKNEELYNIMSALGIENGLDGLRYNRVVIATDADDDGMHIRNLLLTFFLRFFEELVTRGHVYFLETPLFRVRTKAQTMYCYSEGERDAAQATLGKNAETTRFKGLGEISPKEFTQFIGKDIRLVPIDVESLSEVHKALDFYMGKNTPMRKDFIISNLIYEVN